MAFAFNKPGLKASALKVKPLSRLNYIIDLYIDLAAAVVTVLQLLNARGLSLTLTHCMSLMFSNSGNSSRIGSSRLFCEQAAALVAVLQQ